MQGWYHDPLHGHCLRRVRRISPDVYEVIGVYGNDEAPSTHRAWTARMTVLQRSGDTIRLTVDFAGKPTKKNRCMTALYKNRCIHWIEDGNVWHQLFVHPRQWTA